MAYALDSRILSGLAPVWLSIPLMRSHLFLTDPKMDMDMDVDMEMSMHMDWHGNLCRHIQGHMPLTSRCGRICQVCCMISARPASAACSCWLCWCGDIMVVFVVLLLWLLLYCCTVVWYCLCLCPLRSLVGLAMTPNGPVAAVGVGRG